MIQKSVQLLILSQDRSRRRIVQCLLVELSKPVFPVAQRRIGADSAVYPPDRVPAIGNYLWRWCRLRRRRNGQLPEFEDSRIKRLGNAVRKFQALALPAGAIALDSPGPLVFHARSSIPDEQRLSIECAFFPVQLAELWIATYGLRDGPANDSAATARRSDSFGSSQNGDAHQKLDQPRLDQRCLTCLHENRKSATRPRVVGTLGGGSSCRVNAVPCAHVGTPRKNVRPRATKRHRSCILRA
jgi:hypothetical protein